MNNRPRIILVNLRPQIFLILAILCSLPSVLPLLKTGYHWGAHDARHSVYYLYEFNKVIQDGIWWPRWGPDWAFGYGYPFWNMYAPFSTYLGEIFVLLGFDIITSVKIVFGLSLIFSAVTMYYFAFEILGEQAAFISSVVYVYIPYHLFNVYTRAALAESVGFVFIPLVFLGFHRLVCKPTLRGVLATSVAYAGLMLSSNLLAAIFTPLLGLYVFILLLLGMTDKLKFSARSFQILIRSGLPPLFGLMLGIGLSSIFVLPALAETKYIRIDQWTGGRYAFGNGFVNLFGLFPFTFEHIGRELRAGIIVSPGLGITFLVILIISLFRVRYIEKRLLRNAMFIFQGLAIAIIILVHPISKFLWFKLEFMQFVQFPWRLLSISSISLALIAGLIFQRKWGDNSRLTRIGIILFFVALALHAYSFLKTEMREPTLTEGPVSLAGLFRFQQASDEMTGVTNWAHQIPSWSALAENVIQGQKEIESRINYAQIAQNQTFAVYSFNVGTAHEMLWVYATDDTQRVPFLIHYYPGWTAYLYADTGPGDAPLQQRIGNLVSQPEIQISQQTGHIVVSIPSGEHILLLRFEDTPVRKVGKFISFLSLSLIVILIIADRIYYKGRLPFVASSLTTQCTRIGKQDFSSNWLGP